ncbi:MAG: hypothetical protein JXR37_30575 [Kiritimatiellae bacterium]|nr:hypothetical protein [Kiritimatiellia bacterium]
MKKFVILGVLAVLCMPIRECAAWRAYNDLCWTNSQVNNNITVYTRNEGGVLVDYATGSNLTATLTVNAGGDGPYTDQGTQPIAGTDAHTVFNGIVNTTGLISYGDTDVTLTFENLDPAEKYDVVVFGDRNSTSYGQPNQYARITKYTISDVVAFQNESSVGARVTTTIVKDDSTIVTNGYNALKDGFVGRYTQIEPGTDGDLVITVSDGGSNSAPKFYVSAVLIKTVPEPLPVLVCGIGILLAALRLRKR